METIKLAKYLASVGVASRRRSEEMILAGQVVVNGQVETNVATRILPGQDQVWVEGQAVSAPERLVVLALNKPVGVISTVSDPEGRPTVMDYLPAAYRSLRLFPVGRLDEESQGLIILTNDGALAYRLTHPKFEVPKTYWVQTNRRLTDREYSSLEYGVRIQGRLARPAGVKLIDNRDAGALIEIVLTEGRNRQVRRMMKAINQDVLKLERRNFGPYQLADLALGKVRLESERQQVAVAKE